MVRVMGKEGEFNRCALQVLEDVIVGDGKAQDEVIIIKMGVDEGLTENGSVDRWKRLYSRNAMEKEMAGYKQSGYSEQGSRRSQR